MQRMNRPKKRHYHYPHKNWLGDGNRAARQQAKRAIGKTLAQPISPL